MSNPFGYPAMHPRVRDTYLKILKGYTPHQAITEPLMYLDIEFPRAKLSAALHYLVKNQITGQAFVEWFHGKLQGSKLRMHAELLRILERERQLRVVMRKDFN